VSCEACGAPTVCLNDLLEAKKELERARTALRALYDLKEGLAKPEEHMPTRLALRATEAVLFGYSNL
jgi:hypothetical protein